MKKVPMLAMLVAAPASAEVTAELCGASKNEETFFVAALTLGNKLGSMPGGKGQVFNKPSPGVVSDRPTG
jgi:hypothetical protein